MPWNNPVQTGSLGCLRVDIGASLLGSTGKLRANQGTLAAEARWPKGKEANEHVRQRVNFPRALLAERSWVGYASCPGS